VRRASVVTDTSKSVVLDRELEVEFESRKYQVEVEILENTQKYVHVMVSVDDGSLPASSRPVSASFIRQK